MRFSTVLAGAALACGLTLCAGAASAQQAPAPGAQPVAQPTDVKGIGDWTVRCFPITSASPCEMYEEADDKNSRQRVLGVSIAFVPSTNRHLMQISVPLGVSIEKGLVIQSDSYTSPVLHYRRCDRAGCYIEMVLDNAAVDSLTKAGPKALIKIFADNGKPFDLGFSLNGFAGAHDAMSELARAKAKTPPPAGAAPAAPAP